MEKFTKFNDLNVFFIGIGGISMSALAQFCMCFGANISGSDIAINPETRKLASLGATIYHGHNEKNITKNIDIVVYSGAIHSDNPEYKMAQNLGLKMMERSEFLGVVMGLYDKSIVVTGTHGKTTTTALVGEIFIRNTDNPSIHLGGEAVSFGNAKIGNKKVFVSEGCEYRNSIQYLKPNIALITNIELDHTDFYENYEMVENAFLNFAEQVQDTVLIFENNDFAKKINAKNHVITVGFDGDYDIVGKNLRKNTDGTYTFDVFYDTYIGRFKTNLYGLHNAKNALCAIAIGVVSDVPSSIIYTAVREFKGVKRRMECVGLIGGTKVICDYAHHPTEIKNSIECVSSGGKRVLCVFQPHTFSRTIGLKIEFQKCFNGVAKLVLFKTYPAREKYIVGGSAKELFNSLKFRNKSYCDTILELADELKNAEDYDVVLVLGAGDIYEKTKKAIKKGGDK